MENNELLFYQLTQELSEAVSIPNEKLEKLMESNHSLAICLYMEKCNFRNNVSSFYGINIPGKQKELNHTQIRHIYDKVTLSEIFFMIDGHGKYGKEMCNVKNKNYLGYIYKSCPINYEYGRLDKQPINRNTVNTHSFRRIFVK